jgi:GMP synthase-like glutamine amidotransferase
VRVLVLRHHEEDSPGFVADAFAARGARIDVRLFPDEGPLPDLSRYAHAVVLGSKWSVYEDDRRPWIAEELRWLRAARAPVLGICFGAQALTAAFGGAVERAPLYEVGWVTVEPVAKHKDAPAIGAGPWLQFHGDRCVLGPRAELLATNEVGVQAFSVGRHLGVQFHPEVDAAQLARWLELGGREVVVEVGKDPDAILEETAEREPEAARRADELVGAYLAHAEG